MLKTLLFLLKIMNLVVIVIQDRKKIDIMQQNEISQNLILTLVLN
mgnify:CR=1 FL=1